MTILRGIAAAGLVFLAAGEASAACSGRFAGSPPLSGEYDPFAAADTAIAGRVTIENTGSVPCVFEIAAQPAPAIVAHGPIPQFELRGPAGDVLAASGLGPKDTARAIRHPLAPGERAEIRVHLRLPAGQMLPPGRHELIFEVTLAEAGGGGGRDTRPLLDRGTLPASLRIDDRIGLNIAGAGVARTIDFGELRQGDSRRVLIEARGNRNFLLEATSRNGGALSMDAPHQQWRIPYTLMLGGVRTQLPARAGPFAPTSIAGQQLEVLFVIGDVAAKRAGLYTDELTIEIKPAL
jgi:hypothetical protein